MSARPYLLSPSYFPFQFLSSLLNCGVTYNPSPRLTARSLDSLSSLVFFWKRRNMVQSPNGLGSELSVVSFLTPPHDLTRTLGDSNL